MSPSPKVDRHRPLRVAMLGKGLFPDEVGGLDRYFTNLYDAYRHRDDVESRALVVGDACGVPGVRGVSKHAAPLWRRVASVARAGRSLDADVVDAHFALYALPAVLAGGLRRRPLLVHFQGPWAEEGVAAGDTSRVRRRAKRTIERRVYRRARSFVVLSEAFKRVLVEKYGVPPWLVVVDRPGVDAGLFSPGDREAARAALGAPSDTFVACTVRRLTPRMGIDVLLEGWPTVVDRLHGRALLVVVGDGPIRVELEARAAALGLSDSVRFLGRITQPRLVEVYRAADVNVLPSVAHEGFGLVVLEAAACGTPSIVTRVDGLPEAVRGLDASLIVEPASPDSLAQRLTAAAEGELPSREAARQFAEPDDWHAVAERNLAQLRRAAAGERPEKLRVVYLDHVARMSGGEIALLRLLPHLDGVDAHVILAEHGQLVEAMREAGISTEVLAMPRRAREVRKDSLAPFRLSPLAAAQSAVYTLRLARRLRQLAPDLVHTNSLKAGLYGSLAAKLAGVPVVWHVRDRVAPDYLPPFAVRFVRALIRRLPDVVVANSEATLDTLDRPPNSAVVYSVVPEVVPAAAAGVRTASGERTTFGMIGRLAAWKGQDVFIDAFARAFPDGTQRAIIVGDAMFGEAERQYASDLVARARRLGMAERIEFRGFRQDVWRELGEIDVLVHASRTPEPFGQVVLEGMAAGLAVVATDGGGPRELIADGESGLLYPAQDVEGLAAILTALDRDATLRRSLGEAAKARALDFRPEPIAGRVQDLYTELLERARRG